MVEGLLSTRPTPPSFDSQLGASTGIYLLQMPPALIKQGLWAASLCKPMQAFLISYFVRPV